MPRRAASRQHLAHWRSRSLMRLVLALAPAVAAVWCVPGFVTQDGPAHLYNAHIIEQSLRPESPFAGYYEVRWELLPNWAGHLALVGLLRVVPPNVADRLMMTVTLVGLAAAVVWLRWRISGWRGMPSASLLAALLALNIAWLFGFTSFLLGACLFCVTLGVWWAGREWPGPLWAITLGILLALGYFCHLVSLGLTVVGMLVLSAADSGPLPGRRWGWTLASFLPLVPLGVIYRGLAARSEGGIHPEWGHLTDPFSPASWASQVGWAEPLSLATKRMLPFCSVQSVWCAVAAPLFWAVFALVLLVLGTLLGRDREEAERARQKSLRGWGALALVLILAGMLGPDTIGKGHGHYLSQRVVLLGLVALVPWLQLHRPAWLVRVCTLALGVALLVQSAWVWDYAFASQDRAGQVAQARAFVGNGQRLGTLLIDIRGRHRANPLLHADCLLGVGTGNIVWSNYETVHYYFPVHLRDDVAHPPVAEFEALAMLEGPRGAGAERAERWRALLERYGTTMDALVIWGTDPKIESASRQWYDPRVQLGEVGVWKRKPAN